MLCCVVLCLGTKVCPNPVCLTDVQPCTDEANVEKKEVAGSGEKMEEEEEEGKLVELQGQWGVEN